MSSSQIPVAVLGATGSVGQRFISLLDNHPWFNVVALAASDRSVGQKYSKAARWVLDTPMPDYAKDMVVVPANTDAVQAKIVFSALHTEIANELEPQFAKAGAAVCSNASSYRRGEDVPLLLPEINADHIQLIKHQRQNKGWSGCIITNPNCTSTGLTIALKVLDNEFGVKKVFAVSLQALSGAGYPGVPSLDIMDNIIPNVANGGEEEKVEWEPRKMLGKFSNNQIELADIKFSAHTNRVAVIDGHTVCASIALSNPVEPEVAIRALREYCAPPSARELPSSPRPVIDHNIVVLSAAPAAVPTTAPAPPASAPGLTDAQKRVIAAYGSDMLKAFTFLYQQAREQLEPLGATEETIRAAASGALIACQRKLGI